MTSQAIAPSFTERRLLKRTLLTNMAFSALSGIICLVAAPTIATFLGLSSAIPVFILGLLLLVFAYDVFLIARQSPISTNKATVILLMDILWVVGSAILLIADPFTYTTQGRWAILIVADLVGVFAILEFIGIRQLNRQ